MPELASDFAHTPPLDPFVAEFPSMMLLTRMTAAEFPAIDKDPAYTPPAKSAVLSLIMFLVRVTDPDEPDDDEFDEAYTPPPPWVPVAVLPKMVFS